MATGELRPVSQTINVEWEVADFSTSDVEVDTCYDGPEFFFSESIWYLTLRPNGEKKCDSEGWVGLYVRKKKMGPQRHMKCRLAIMSNEGKMEQSSMEIFCGKENGWGYAKFIEKSKLAARRSDFVKSGVLTFKCILISGESRRVEAPLFTRLLDLSRSLKDVLDHADHNDVVLKAGGLEIKAHRAILESRSSVFGAMFSHEMVEARTGVVTVDDTEPDVLRQVLSYVYSGDVENLADDNVFQVYAAADKYDLQGLKALCANYMEGSMSENIVCDVMATAYLYKETRLKELSKTFFTENTAKILESDSWEKLVREKHAVAIQLLTSVVLENSRDKK